MTDLRFNDVVETTSMIGPNGKYVQSVCKTCSKQRKVHRDEFALDDVFEFPSGDKFIPDTVDEDALRFVCGMRAWNCCHKGEEPLDGFPDVPDIACVEFEDV